MKIIGIIIFLAVAWLSLASEPFPDRTLRKFFHPYEHLVVFTVFAFVSFWAWRGKGVVVLIGLLTVAGLMELIQMFLPTRAFQLEDLVANFLGIALGGGLYLLTHWVWAHRRGQKS